MGVQIRRVAPGDIDYIRGQQHHYAVNVWGGLGWIVGLFAGRRSRWPLTKADQASIRAESAEHDQCGRETPGGPRRGYCDGCGKHVNFCICRVAEGA